MWGKKVLGIFDSGVGGFSVYVKLKEITTANTVYYGDCARAPYGNKEEEEIKQFIKDDIKFLQDENVTHFVNACNSMSVSVTDELLKECNVKLDRYTDMIRAIDKYTTFIPHEKILVLATAATIRSGVYRSILTKKGVEVFEFPLIALAGAIEANAPREQLLSSIKSGMLYAKECGATTVLYGCTHYPLVHGLFLEIQKSIEWDGTFIDPAVYVAKEVATWNLEGDKKFYPFSSKDTPAFINSIVRLL